MRGYLDGYEDFDKVLSGFIIICDQKIIEIDFKGEEML